MAGKSDTFENDILKLFFNATPIANLADNAATAPNTLLWISLHTADPLAGATEGSAQTTSEATYTGYARQSVARTTGGFTVSTDAAGVTRVNLAAALPFPQATAGSNTITHFAIGTAQTGAGKILYAGTVSPNIAVTTGVQPQLTTATYVQED